MQRSTLTMAKYPHRALRPSPLRTSQALPCVLPLLGTISTSTLKNKTRRLPPLNRAFHSSRHSADYMKQVMSPMTGHEGEQTPSEESNTLREIDRLFTIISSEIQFTERLHSWLITSRAATARECLSEDLDNASASHAGSKVRSMVGC